MGILLRAARQLGQQRLFENSGPALWAAVRDELEMLPATLAQRRRARRQHAGRGVRGALRSHHHDAGRHRRRPGHRHRGDHRRPADPAHHRHARPAQGGGSVREGRLMPIPVPEGEDPASPFGAFAFHVHFSPRDGASSTPMDGIDPAISGGFSEVTRPRGHDGGQGDQGRRPQLRRPAASGPGHVSPPSC